MTEQSSEHDRRIGRASTRPASWWLAWSLAGLCVALFAVSVPLDLLARSPQSPGGLARVRAVVEFLVAVPYIAFPLVGALIVAARPRNMIGWICLAEGFLWNLLILFDVYSAYGLDKPGSLPFPAAVAALGQWLWVPAVGLLAVYLPLLFPNGRLPSERWRPLAWLSAAAILVLVPAEGLKPGPIPDLGGVRNPFGLERAPWVETASNAVLMLLLLCILASASSLVIRYRRSRGEEREQIKWIALAGSLVGLLYVSAMVFGIIATALQPGPNAGPLPPWFDLLFSLALLSFGSVPVAVGFAVLKYRLYDVDVLINRALVYGSLTVSLVAVYLGGIVLLQRIFVFLTGEQSTLAVVASTLAIAAMFNPSETAHPIVNRPSFLPQQVRRGEDARGLLGHAARRDRPG